MDFVLLDSLPNVDDYRGTKRKRELDETNLIDRILLEFEKSDKLVMLLKHVTPEYNCVESCRASLRCRILLMEKPWNVIQIRKQIYIYKINEIS